MSETVGYEAGTLVVAARERIDQEIHRQLSAYDDSFATAILGRRVSKMLETSRNPMLLAVHDLGWVPGTVDAELKNMDLIKEEAKGVSLSRDQIYELNRHPYMRTTEEIALARRLGVTFSDIIGFTLAKRIVPVVLKPEVGNPNPEDLAAYKGYYDLDQQAFIENAIQEELKEERYISVEEVLTTLGMVPETFEKIKNHMGLRVIELTPTEKDPGQYIDRQTYSEIIRLIRQAKEARALAQRRLPAEPDD